MRTTHRGDEYHKPCYQPMPNPNRDNMQRFLKDIRQVDGRGRLGAAPFAEPVCASLALGSSDSSSRHNSRTGGTTENLRINWHWLPRALHGPHGHRQTGAESMGYWPLMLGRDFLALSVSLSRSSFNKIKRCDGTRRAGRGASEKGRRWLWKWLLNARPVRIGPHSARTRSHQAAAPRTERGHANVPDRPIETRYEPARATGVDSLPHLQRYGCKSMEVRTPQQRAWCRAFDTSRARDGLRRGRAV